MLNKFKLLVLATAVVASSSAAFAASPTQDRWFVDSGRYVDGQIPSYSDPAHNQALIEGRNSAVIANSSTGREALVEATGN